MRCFVVFAYLCVYFNLPRIISFVPRLRTRPSFISFPFFTFSFSFACLRCCYCFYFISIFFPTSSILMHDGVCVCVLATETYAYNYRKKAHRINDFLISRGFNRSGMSGYRSTICFLACWLQKSMPTASFTVCSGRNSSISTHMRASERVCVLSAFYYYRMCEARLRTRICISYRTETWNVKCASERQNKIYLLK